MVWELPSSRPSVKTPFRPSFLSRRVAALAESLIRVTLEATPKPERFEVSFEETASFSWPPPNLALSGELRRVVFSTRLFSGRLWPPRAKTRTPSCSTEPTTSAGSSLPPETGKVATPALKVAPPVAFTLTPFAFRSAEKEPANVSLV